MIEYLIVGGGFSGIAFAWELEKRGISYKLADPGNDASASSISGGLINPISGRKFAPQWNIENLLPLIKITYKEIEKKLQCNLLSETQILKIHKSEAALEDWLQASQKNNIDYFVENNFNASAFNRFLDFRFGAVMIKQVLRVDTSIYFSRFLEFIGDKHIKLQIDHNAITIKNDYVIYDNNQYRKILFCEGISALNNPWFNKLTFKPAKGECLIAEIPNFNPALIIQRGIQIIPLSNNKFWVGATNTWNDLESSGTEAGLEELTSQLNTVLKVPYTIVEHKAAIRPTMRDRAPVVGKHPEIDTMYFLNGMGTKGASLSTYYAQLLLENIQNESEIPKEANISRFYDLLRK